MERKMWMLREMCMRVKIKCWWNVNMVWNGSMNLKVITGLLSGSVSNDDGDGNENGKKAKQQLCTFITLFCTFLCRRCTTTTSKCVISRFVEGGSTRQQLSFSFPELWYSPLEFNSKIIWRIKRDGISAITFEAAGIHFLSDVFVAFAVLVA